MRKLKIIGLSLLAIGCIFLSLGIVFSVTNQLAIEKYKNTSVEKGSNTPFPDLPCYWCYAWVSFVLIPIGVSLAILTEPKPREKTPEEIEEYEMKTLVLSIITSVGILFEGILFLPVPYGYIFGIGSPIVIMWYCIKKLRSK